MKHMTVVMLALCSYATAEITIVNQQNTEQSFEIADVWQEAYGPLFQAADVLGKVVLQEPLYLILKEERFSSSRYSAIADHIQDGSIPLDPASLTSLLFRAQELDLVWAQELLVTSDAYVQYMIHQEVPLPDDARLFLSLSSATREQFIRKAVQLSPNDTIMLRNLVTQDDYLSSLFEHSHTYVSMPGGANLFQKVPLPSAIANELLALPNAVQTELREAYFAWTHIQIQRDERWSDYQADDKAYIEEHGQDVGDIIEITLRHEASGTTKTMLRSDLWEIQEVYDKQTLKRSLKFTQQPDSYEYTVQSSEAMFNDLEQIADIARYGDLPSQDVVSRAWNTLLQTLSSREKAQWTTLVHEIFSLKPKTTILTNLIASNNVRNVLLDKANALWAEEIVIDTLYRLIQKSGNKMELFSNDAFLELFENYHDTMLSRPQDVHMQPDKRNKVIIALADKEIVSRHDLGFLELNLKAKRKVYLDLVQRDIEIVYNSQGESMWISKTLSRGSRMITDAIAAQTINKQVTLLGNPDMTAQLLTFQWQGSQDRAYRQMLAEEMVTIPSENISSWAKEKITILTKRGMYKAITSWIPWGIKAAGIASGAIATVKGDPITGAKRVAIMWIGANAFEWAATKWFTKVLTPYTQSDAMKLLQRASDLGVDWFTIRPVASNYLVKFGSTLADMNAKENTVQILYELHTLSDDVVREVARSFYELQRGQGKSHQDSLLKIELDYGLALHDLVDVNKRRFAAPFGEDEGSPDSFQRLYNSETKTLDLQKKLISSLEGLDTITQEDIPIKKVKVIDLSENLIKDIKTIDRSVWNNFSQLDELRLNHNSIEVIDVDFISALPTRITTLDLSSNRIRYLSSESFSFLLDHCEYLDTIKLNENILSDDVFDMIRTTLERKNKEVRFTGQGTQKDLSFVERVLRALSNFSNKLVELFPRRASLIRTQEQKIRARIQSTMTERVEILRSITEGLEAGTEALKDGKLGLALDDTRMAQDRLGEIAADTVAEFTPLIDGLEQESVKLVRQETKDVQHTRHEQEEVTLAEREREAYRRLESQQQTQERFDQQDYEREQERIDKDFRDLKDRMANRHERETEIREQAEIRL